MSILDDIKKEQDLMFRKHEISLGDKGYLCIHCKINAWDENFPEYCVGPVTELNLGKLDTNTDLYKVKAKIIHLHKKALIEFQTSGSLDEDIVFDIDLVDIDDLLNKLQQIKNTLEN